MSQMTDEYEIVEKAVLILRNTHDIEGYTIDNHTLNHIVGIFIEQTGKGYTYSYKKVLQILTEMGYRVA